ncbi:MAG: quinone-dependent dihydroorotate dehydrogenase [Paracoccaceae bacterium]|nr:quinone-dependent dihydroorotate dehydrogenase [Paracoccaceae bacterium]
MTLRERLGLMALHRLDPEWAHRLALGALNLGLAPIPKAPVLPQLECDLAGLKLPNPLGLAAGFDKNAQVITPIATAGFGFIEVGAATPRPQDGNAKPRMFRLTEDHAVINRFGFNNHGMAAILQRLEQRPKGLIVGLNLGANKDSTDHADDFSQVLSHCGHALDFATVNVSSPNTESLRDLQGKAALSVLLERVLGTRTTLPRQIPIFVKIAPDLSQSELEDVADVALSTGIDGIIATNTTLARNGLKSRHRNEKGGLSGIPLFEKSTKVLAQLSELTQGTLPLIGVGGIGSAEDAYAKIRAGAHAVQLYSGLVYSGLSLVQEITTSLGALLKRDGFATVANAVGSGRADWL